MTAENKECIQTCNKCIELDSKFTKAYYRRAKAHINMKNFLEGAKDYKRILILEPENTSVKEELEAVVKKNLGELQVKELEDLTVVIQTKPEVASQPTAQSKPSAVAAPQPQTFKRVNIVEEDDEDEEEEVKSQVTTQAASVAEAPKAPVPAAAPQPEPAAAKPVVQPHAAPKIDKSVFLRELAKVQDVKAKAVDEIKKSMYEDAVALMKKTSEFFEDEEDRLVGLTPEQLQEYFNLKMSLHSNMALCYQQMDFPKKVIEYSDVVLDTFKAIGENQLQKDFNVLEKTLHRKALALEKCEKFKDARLLYYEIRKLSPTNMMASQGIQRCDEFLEDRHVDLSTPSSFKAPEDKQATPTPVTQKAPEKKLEPIVPLKPVHTPEPQKPAKVEELSSGLSAPLKAFLAEYEKQKDTANGAFRENKFDQAIGLYTKLIEQIELKHPEVVGHHNASFADPTAADLLKLFVSLLSNRSMSYIKVTRFLLGLLDCDKILMLDPKNPKVYHRKYVCEEELARELRLRRKDLKQKEVVIDLINKEVGYLQNAISDLRILTSQAKEPQYEKKVAELEQLISFDLKQRDTLQKELDAAKQTPGKTVLVEEISKTDNVTEEKPAPRPAQTQAPKPHVPEGGATELDIDAITRKALNEIITTTNTLPNANKFELDMKSFKTHYSLMWQYFEKFQDWWFLSVIYAKREPDAKCLEQVLNCLLTKAQEDASRAEDSATVLLSFKKVHNAKLALKFLSKAGKAKMGEAAQYLLKTVGNASYEYSITNEFGEYLA